MNDREVQRHAAQWIESTLSQPSPDFNGLPPCPYSQSTLSKGKLDVRFESGERLLETLGSIAEGWDDSFDVIMVMCDPLSISPEALAEGAMCLSERLQAQDLLVNFDHPCCRDNPHKVVSTNGKYAMGAIQRLKNFVDAAGPLFKKGYYSKVDHRNLVQYTSYKGHFSSLGDWLSSAPNIRPFDFRPKNDTLVEELLEGLTHHPKSIGSKINYQTEGAELYEKVCATPGYYLTRTELAIMERCIQDIARCFKETTLMVEYGSGNSRKTELLFDHLPDLIGYVPIDFSRDKLFSTAARIAHARSELEVLPVCADYTKPFELPRPSKTFSRRLFYYPGSTIGNQEPTEAVGFLQGLRQRCKTGDALLIGVDLQKDPHILRQAYDDPEGVHREFIMNPLAVLQRELDVDLDPSRFCHRVDVDPQGTCVEISMECLEDHLLEVAGTTIAFQRGERVRRAVSYKYSLDGFQSLAKNAGWRVEHIWTDEQGWFSVQDLRAI